MPAHGDISPFLFTFLTISVCFQKSIYFLFSVSITVDAVAAPNDPPVATDDSAITGQNSLVSVLVLSNDTDPDSDTLTNSGVVS